MKYARVERERRFLLRDLPPDLPTAWKLVTDWYISGTRLRLRTIESPAGEVITRKLTQKYCEPGQSPARTTITNIYLNRAEFDRLRCLGGDQIRKRRYAYELPTGDFVIDVFEGPLSGLILAEIEFEDEESMAKFQQPEFADADVTASSYFTGGHLSAVSSANLRIELTRWLEQVGGPNE